MLTNTIACSRQCRAPRSTNSGESRAPCKKNNNAMEALVSQLTAAAASVRAGINAAKATVSRIAARNFSMRDQAERIKFILCFVCGGQRGCDIRAEIQIEFARGGCRTLISP